MTRVIYAADSCRANVVTLPTIPGIELDSTRTDTAPRQPMIRRPMGPVKGAALRAMSQHRIAAIIEAIREARDEMGVGE